MGKGGDSKGQGAKGKGGEGKGNGYRREVRPATSGVAVVLPAPPPRPGSSSNQIDSNPNRGLTRAVRSQIEFSPRRLELKWSSNQGG